MKIVSAWRLNAEVDIDCKLSAKIIPQVNSSCRYQFSGALHLPIFFTFQ